LPSIAGLNEEFKAYTEKLFYTLAWQRGIQRYSVIVFLISGDKLSTHCCDVCLLYVRNPDKWSKNYEPEQIGNSETDLTFVVI
jgi:hypothetical protein